MSVPSDKALREAAEDGSPRWQLALARKRIAELEAEVERLREVHDTGYCREHDSYLGTDGPLGCLVPFAGKGRSA